MTVAGLRERLSDVWLVHHHTGCGHCRCGHRPDHGLSYLKAHASHIADVLLSLPGIAIVELPEPDKSNEAADEWGNAVTFWRTANGERSITNQAATLMFPDSARRLAAALLAAANAAEQAAGG